MATEQFSLKWNNHTRHIVGVFESLLQSESLVDVTLCCEGQSLRAHKLVLSACSPYFKTLFQEHADSHPIVILKDVKFGELRSIVQFMYKGEVEVEQSDIASLISTAESLQIRGLAETRTTVTGLQFPPSEPRDPTPRPEPPEALLGHDRKRTLSDLDAGGGGGEPPPPSSVAGTPAASSSNGEDSTVIKRPKTEQESGEENSVDGMDSVVGAPSQLCQPELLTEPPASHDPQLHAALASVGATPTTVAMPHQQRGVMQQQLQMLQEYMLPMLSNLSMGITMPGATVDVISNTAPVNKTGMSGLSCTVCAMIMPDLPTLEQHLRIHEEEKPYKCLQCGQRYKYQSAYQRHIDMNHTARLPQEKPYRCEVCGQFFKYLKSFHKHRANHTAIDRILNTTGDDSATTSAAEFPGTRAPMPGMMPQLPQQMAARSCLPTETVDSVLRGSAPPEHRPYGNKSLDVDEEEEPNSVTITAIKQERAEVPPLAQPQQELQEPTNQGATSSAAGQSATEAGNGGQSESLPLPESPDPPTDDCSADFIGDDAALAEAGGSGSAKSWICPYCLKGFRGKENLKLHIRTHTGEKPYECGSCDKRFVGKSDLNRHLRIHTGEKPYECNICFRRFARGDYLSKHVVTHSQGGSPQPPGDIGGSTDSTVSEEQTAGTDQPNQP